MRTPELLSELSSKGIKVWAEGDRLRYRAPKSALTPDLRDELVNRKAEILALLHQADTVTNSATLPLTPVSRDRPLALSFAQQRLWFLDQLEPDQSTFNLPWALRLTGGLEVSALEQALSALVDRHDVLRTTFAVGGNGEPIQVIAPAWGGELEHVELASLAPTEPDAELQRQMGERAKRPFDLATGPLLRATLYRLAPEEHVLALTIHHIAFDGWSFGVLARELGAFYTAFVEGHEPALPGLPIQYADYAAWQRQWLQGEVLEVQLEYWRSQLGPELPVLELPTDHPRPAQQRFAGARESYALPEPLLASLRSLSQREGVTLFMTLAAGLKVLLHRYSGQSVITIGTPVANRTRSALESLIGFFVNSLVLSTELEGALSFREALARVREVSLGAYAHQDLPFEQLVEAVRPPRDQSRHPLFQVMFALQNVPFEPMELPGLRLGALPVERSSSQFDLTLYAREAAGGLRLIAEYNTDLFEPETIRQLLGHFETLLAGAVADPEQAISQLPLLSEAERTQLMEIGRGPAAAEGEAATLSGLFEAQARRTPEAVAMVCESERLSYRELDERANRLARHLNTLGVGPGVPVGVCLERAPELLVGLLGILKAGGAYVPLDPSFPAERLAFMLADAQVPVLVTQENLREGLPEHQAELVSLDADAERFAAHATAPLEGAADAEDLAYVIYTSGSTGKPKGVQIPHRAVVNFLTAMQREPGLGPEDVLVAVTTLSFDIAVLELFLPLICGAQMVVASRETAVDGEALAALLGSAGATVMQATPTTWRLLVETGWSGDGRLKALCGGEAWGWDLAAALLARCGSVWNLYGPTETTIWSAVRQVQAGDERVAIGGPIADTQLYVLDECLQPAPVGVPGELFIGGAGVARGYLNRPELTAERFLADPLDADGRLYRTGDRVRYLTDGSLEFLGRLDHQVKLRGYRIELGEIEAVLGTYPGVKQAVVVVREDVPGDQRLVAYLVADAAPDTGELRSLARSRLPEYMVPTAWVTLEAFPLTPNRKVDRKALPAPEGLGVAPEAAYVAPRTPDEEVLAGIWAEVLGLKRIGTEDNFFELGGHSLLATQVIARVRDGLGVEVPLRALFEGPTVAELAGRVATLRDAEQGLEALPLVGIPRDQPLALSFAQQRLWFLDQLEPDQSAFNLTMALRMTGGLEVGALERALSAIVNRHEVLRTAFAAAEDGEPVQVIARSGVVELEQVELVGLAPAERDAELQRQMGERANRPFDLATGPVLRTTLYRLAPEAHVLTLTIHHIAFDGWSFGVLAAELGAFYTAFVEGREPALPGLPIQYADYAAWQRQWLQGDVLEAQIEYWRRQLGPDLPVLELPTDHPRPAVQSFAGARESYALSRPLVDSLRSLSQREGVTLFMTLAAGLKVLFHRYSGQSVITIGTPVANRTRSALEPLIGFFVNSLVLSTELEGELSFREALARVREVSLGAYAHQDLPFEQLVEAVRPQRDQSRHPLFQVMFALQNVPVEGMELPGLKLGALPVERSSSQFDLTLFAREGAGGLSLSAEYNTDLFERETIRRMLAHYETLLAGAVAEPITSIAALPILSPAEYHQVTEQWNDTRADYPDQASIHRLFELQVERSPEAVALIDDVQQLTYRELNGRANQLAHFLQTQELAATDLVGVCLERSAEMVVAMLAVLKTGAAYVPLDPAYPRERLAFMLGDAQVSLLLTSEGLSELLPDHSAQTVYMDAQWPTIAQADESNLAVTTTPESPAYVLYTSGSTGTPKGVVGRHRGAVNRFAWMWDQYPFAAHEVCCQKTSLNFVDSVWEIFGPLLQGVPTVIIPNPLLTDPPLLIEFLAQHRVTRMVLVPSLLRVLLETYDDLQDRLPQLTHWICSGEALSLELYNRFQAVMPQSTLLNLYGSSEVAADVTCFDTRRMHPEASSVPIGRPIANTELYVLDLHLSPVPIGVPAELYVGGAGLAQGYLNRPDLTEERFIPNPFSSEPDACLYKTGDIVRYRPDGNLEYLGRTDHQVKIRGFRIELGEIETVLASHPAVRETVVVIREDVPDDKRIVAYVVSTDEPLSPRDLRQALKKRLPEYMVPAHFVTLDALPLTPNRKVDRRALPAPEGLGVEPEAAYVAPSTPDEEVLAGIWAEVLGLERIGTEDNFFELGGHSLLATQVFARVRDRLEVDVPLRALFEGPTVAELARRVTKLKQGERGLEAPPLVCITRDQPLALSFAQQRLWFLDQLEPDQSAFNLGWAVRLTGGLEVGALEQALSTIVDRHEVLRTTFAAAEDGEPVQVIARSGTAELEHVELAGLAPAERDAELQRQMGERANRPFDLATGPVLRATLYRLAPEAHVLTLTIHHIAFDGWSFGVLARELGAFYTAFVEGHEPALPELPIQYADYAAWQRQWLQGEVLEAQIEYWRRQLGPELPVLELPTDHPRPAQQSFAGALESYALSESLLASLRSLSQREGVTLFMTLATGLKALFHRYSGQSVITIGTPVANRTRSALESLIGFFVNSLVLSTELSGALSFREALARVREVSLGAYAHQDLPFEQLVEAVRPPRDLSRHPLFQVMFALQNVPSEGMELSGIQLSAMPAGRSSSQFDLTLFAREGAGGLRLIAEYNTDLFEPETIRQLLGHFETLLAGAVADPEQAISQLPLLSEAERTQLMEIGRGPAAAEGEAATLSGLFEAQARRTPEAVAMVCESERLSYRELDERTNRLARHLNTLGVGPGVPVGVCLERSPELLVGLLGILKAGGAYVPLDPSFPAERLAFMLADAQVPVLVTQENLREGLPEHQAELVSLDADAERFAAHATAPLEGAADAEDLAYVIYTSGSTGKPKGVQIPHRAVVNFLTAMQREPGLGPEDVLVAVTTLSFDIAVLELFLPLICGAQMVVASRETAVDGEALAALLGSAGATVMQATPTTWRLLVETGWSGDGRLKALCGGEAWGWDLAAALLARCGSVWNLYGPTETTIWSAVRQVQAGDERVAIGGPIADTQLYVLDECLQPAPVGVPGELFIGGAGVARGYLNRPELTAERFLADPLDADGRLYRTGDRVRYLTDGSLEFLGRLDHQVKLRGYRIELGEIEAVLATHSSVKQAVVVVREDVPGDQRLVAYLVADPEPDTGELRSLARSRLPEYMVPTAWVTLEAFPLTPNRKVDRRALPNPEGLGVEPEAAYVAPRTPDEEALADIWAEVLGLERVGTRDNFFDLGGHSLLALRLRALMEKRLKKDIPLAILFQAPTIEQLAEMLDEGFQPAAWTSLVPMQTEGSNPPFFCVPEAGSTVYSLSDLARHLGAKQPFYGLQPVGMDGDGSPHTRIEDMAAHYIEEIKSVQPEGPYLLGGQCFGSEVAFEMAQQLCAQGEEVALLALIGDNFIAAWARKGVGTSDAAYSLAHSFKRAFYYFVHSPLGDVVRTTLKEVNIRFNPRLRYTRRVFKAQLLARANYLRKPYPGRVTAFTARSSSLRTFSKLTLAGLAEGGVDLQRVPPVYDKLLDEPHVQVVAANLIACIKKVVDERSWAKTHTSQPQIAHAKKKNGGSSPQVSVVDKSPRSTYVDAPPTDPRKCLDLSLVLPCYNEASHFSDSIREIVRVLDAAELEYEIILIDDRSTDETAQLIRSYLSDQHTGNIHAFFHDVNLGRGATVAEGIRRARSNYVGFIDIDLETPPQFIPAALGLLVSDSADMILGDRKMVRPLQLPLHLVMSKGYRWLVNRLLKTNSLDTEAGFKFFRKDLILPVLDGLQDSHWSWDTEITCVAQAKGLRIYSLPVTYRRDLTKQSTVRVFHDSWGSFASLLAFTKRHRFAKHDAAHNDCRDEGN